MLNETNKSWKFGVGREELPLRKEPCFSPGFMLFSSFLRHFRIAYWICTGTTIQNWELLAKWLQDVAFSTSWSHNSMHAQATFQFHAKMSMPDLNLWIRYLCFLFLLFSFKVSRAFLAFKKLWKNYRIFNFSSQKNDGIFHIFDQINWFKDIPLKFGCHLSVEGQK